MFDEEGNEVTKIPPKDTTYKVIYTPTTQEVKFIGEDNKEISRISGKTGEEVNIPDLSKDGYTFKIFKENKEVEIEKTLIIPTKDIEFIVKYTKIKTQETTNNNSTSNTSFPSTSSSSNSSNYVATPKVEVKVEEQIEDIEENKVLEKNSSLTNKKQIILPKEKEVSDKDYIKEFINCSRQKTNEL